MKKWGWLLSVTLTLSSIMVACSGQSGGETKKLSDNKLVVGVTAGPHEEIMEQVKEVAKKEGLDIEIKVFNDYVMPNVALAEKEIDANSFQTVPYLEQFKKDRNLDLVDVIHTVTFPMGIYSNKIKDLKAIANGAKLGIPNDPVNGERALKLFEKAGVIKLKPGTGHHLTVKDIAENKKNVQFVELEASQIPRQLGELTAAAINTNFAIEHGFVPTRDAIFMEGKDSPHVNLIAVRTENKNDPVLKKLEKAYRSAEVKAFIEKEFKGSVIPSW
ncbi:MetQ/NlpA family ABC transporter substrate-binding protein [Laceyella putida]|uniref:Lipoprotein n=1 Tax=Laceyella putida TaxID=110101 RepID=A0ABW2RF11_9BACL